MLIGITLILANIVMFLAPARSNTFSSESLQKGKYSSIVTSVFSHVNTSHLLINLCGIVMGLFLFYEFGFGVVEYLFVYFASAFTSFVPAIILFPAGVFVGASNAVYGTYGSVSTKKHFGIPRGALFSVFMLSIYSVPLSHFLTNTLTDKIISTAVLHSFGFFAGILAYVILVVINSELKKTRKVFK